MSLITIIPAKYFTLHISGFFCLNLKSRSSMSLSKHKISYKKRSQCFSFFYYYFVHCVLPGVFILLSTVIKPSAGAGAAAAASDKMQGCIAKAKDLKNCVSS